MMPNWVRSKGYIEKGRWRITGNRVNGEVVYTLWEKVSGKWVNHGIGELEDLKKKTIRETPVNDIKEMLSKSETKKSDQYKPGYKNESFLHKSKD